MVKYNKKNKGQVVIEYMLLVALAVIGVLIAIRSFNDFVIKDTIQAISGLVSKHCAGCADKD